MMLVHIITSRIHSSQLTIVRLIIWLTFGRAHGKHLSLSLVEHINYSGTKIIGDSDVHLFEWLAFNTIDHSVNDGWGTNHELEALSAHVLDEHCQVELTTATYCEEDTNILVC